MLHKFSYWANFCLHAWRFLTLFPAKLEISNISERLCENWTLAWCPSKLSASSFNCDELDRIRGAFYRLPAPGFGGFAARSADVFLPLHKRIVKKKKKYAWDVQEELRMKCFAVKMKTESEVSRLSARISDWRLSFCSRPRLVVVVVVVTGCEVAAAESPWSLMPFIQC